MHEIYAIKDMALSHKYRSTDFCNQDEYFCVYWENKDFRLEVYYEDEYSNDDGVSEVSLKKMDLSTHKVECIKTIKDPNMEDVEQLCEMAMKMFK